MDFKKESIENIILEPCSETVVDDLYDEICFDNYQDVNGILSIFPK